MCLLLLWFVFLLLFVFVVLAVVVEKNYLQRTKTKNFAPNSGNSKNAGRNSILSLGEKEKDRLQKITVAECRILWSGLERERER